MSEKQVINLYLVSDSAGETAYKLATAIMAQYPDVKFRVIRKAFVKDFEYLEKILLRAEQDNGLVVHTAANFKLIDFAKDFATEHHVFYIDLLHPMMDEITRRTGIAPNQEVGSLHHLDTDYFKRIQAIEFSVKFDDGKNPKGFLDADVVLIGVSRTSKTPLSLYLANKNLKVANLPLVPGAQIPEEIYKVDRKKIIGLTNTPEKLNEYRVERMKAYGLGEDTPYSNIDEVKKELAYADKLFAELDCVVINVAKLSIEETASIILSSLELENYEAQL
ncbi:MAG: kinase/pyrophosphorylase [Lactobacillales bacterium]|jgi:regulator of PEP synthase PpsR (kinase-PPPase family)|nr:kinase/pyrophosphorylase [Lactobacillales bacterium]